ncbi:unnamed protein product [Onchocerca ochengi]|uniref:Uncharacterized protein n=1 Tax=Onchocerca ochengi TaxID=42157 RepID=A0A182ERP6_ONCOC|nr:unnamed protein product [Onchocerca ochengi]
MQRPRRSFEMVLQEACVQYHSVETMRDVHQVERTKTSRNNAANHCDNYHNNNKNDVDFLPTGKKIINDDSIRSPALMKISESFQNQNIQ